MARVDPTAVLPQIEIGDDVEITMADIVVALLVLAFFVATLLAILRRLAVL